MSYPTPSQKSQKKRLPLWLHWWYQLPVSEQDRIFALTPILALAVFISFVVLSYSYLSRQQYQQEQANAQQSAITVAQQIRFLLIDNENKLQNIVLESSISNNQRALFLSQAAALLNEHPEIRTLYWHDLKTNHIYTYPFTDNTAIPKAVTSLDVLTQTITNPGLYPAQKTPLFNYYLSSNKPDHQSILYATTALPDNTHPEFVITAAYDLERLLIKVVPIEVSLNASIWLEGGNDDILATLYPKTTNNNEIADNLPSSKSNITALGDAVSVYAQTRQLHKTVTGSVLFWFTVGLSLFTCTLIIMNWRHIHLLVNAQHATQREINFRRAIEDSITTGLQGFDLEYRVTYVNPAFCKMIGYTENELIGVKAPLPYWPEHLQQTFLNKIQNLQNPIHSGFETQLQKRNGDLFHIILYLSPLIDELGQQNGWIAAINDISESKRSQEELALAGQRFITVLEGMDAAISVTEIGSTKLLFTNNAYHTIFGDNEDIHTTLLRELKHKHPHMVSNDDINQEQRDSLAPSPFKEKALLKFYFEAQDRWVEVRSQFLPWVDGKFAQMLITTDITDRQKAEEQAAIQAEQTQQASRLITMGEMASSVAHELNQPLTAIHNYCSGLIHRVENNMLTQEQLIHALEKTAKQADRAGKITQRIRSFVKKNKPNRNLTSVNEIIENIYDFIEMDSRRRNIKIDIQIEDNLPFIYMDPILIEQVLLNLTRNAAESISESLRPPEQRRIKIQIHRFVDEDAIEKIRFNVIDSGGGISENIIQHLFEAFFTTKSNGLGIGLNLCRSIIESHNGRLSFYNTYQGDVLTGCCFTFSLPIHVEDLTNHGTVD